MRPRRSDDTVVGRIDELVAIRRLIDTTDENASALVLDGDAGMGKTTLWQAGVSDALAAGLVVLVARPGEHEPALPYSGLADLLGRVASDAVEALPPSRQAVVADVLDAAGDLDDAGRLAASRTLLEIVRTLAADGPLLVAVDDLQWLDPPTAQVLEYVVRRIADARVRLLFARRAQADDPLPPGLERVWPASAVERIWLRPLDADELDELVRSRVGKSLSRPQLVRLAEMTGGNPLFALEIASGLGSGSTPAVPHTLADALEARMRVLPQQARDTVLVAAASFHPTPEVVERATADSTGLEAAIEHGVLEWDGQRLRFTHPLLASVAYERSLPTARRDAHRRLAAAVTDPEERLLHVARGSDEESESVAAELEGASSRAAERGAPAVGAELAEAAARLTPADSESDRRRRLVAAAECHVAAGDPARGRGILTALVENAEPGPERATLLWRLADTIGDTIEEPIRLCEQALLEAEGDAGLTSDIHTALGVFTWIAGDLERATEHCRLAVDFADAAGDEVRLAIAIGEACHAQAIVGAPWDRAAMERALAIEGRSSDLPASLRPSFQLAVIALVTDEPDTARPLLAAELARVRGAHDEPGTFQTLFRLAELELRAGNWADAHNAAREAVALARQGGIEQEQATTEMVLALVLAHLGQLDEASSLATSAHRVAVAGGDQAVELRAAGVLGFIELSRDAPDGALAWLTPARQRLQHIGTGELSISGIVQNEIEALVAVGDLDEADSVIAFVEEKALRSGRAWHRAVAARGRGLVASARGDYVAASAAMDEAFAAHDDLPQPFERARSLFAAGAIERRAKHWATARERLTASLELLDQLGAARWAERAAQEVARLPGRRPRGAELTETEHRIAELVALGMSNKEVASRLFVTVRTVEANLTRIYAKLGIRSRTELARKLAEEGSPEPS